MKKGIEPVNPPPTEPPAESQEGATPAAEAQAADSSPPAADAPAAEGGAQHGAPAPQQGPMDETAIKAEKDKIDQMFEGAAPVPDFKEPASEQGELIPEEREYEGTFIIPLTLEDKAACADKFSALQALKDEIELEKAEHSKSCNNKLKSIEEQMKELGIRTREGKSEFKGPCIKRIDREKGKVTIYRKSDWMILEDRDLDLKERQVTMDLPAGAANNVKAGPWSFPRFSVGLDSKTEGAEQIRKALLAVQGIDAVLIFENETEEKDADGRPPHAMEIVVEGGKELEIGRAILEARPGLTTIGARSIVVKGIEIKFSRLRDGVPGQAAEPPQDAVLPAPTEGGEPPAAPESDTSAPAPDPEANPHVEDKQPEEAPAPEPAA